MKLGTIDVNPCGSWGIGGPISDCGVTGRKIVVDQFGGYSNVGGGCLHGKDSSKIDRSDAYMSRYVDLTPSGIQKRFDMLKPIYRKMAVISHYGVNDYKWESLDFVGILKNKMSN